jgi:hypothetical protein
MSHATSVVPSPVILDWTHAAIGPLARCVCCGKPALCRSPVKDVPCHKHCAETWITQHARDAGHLAQLIAAHTPRGGGR